jgi:glutaredoxin-like protein
MEKLLNEKIVKQVKDVFDAQLKNPVALLLFVKDQGCETCADTQQLLEEVVAISDQLSLTVHNMDLHPGIAVKHQVEMAPGLVIAAQDGDQVVDYGVRYAGIPAGHEFSSLIHDIILISNRDSRLSEGTRAELKKLSKPVRLQVFVTPT